jgi:hypothetical protein
MTPQAEDVRRPDPDPDSGLSLGTPIIGAPGSGKTTLATLQGTYGLLRGWGQVFIDPTGSLSTSFLHQVLCLLSEFEDGEDELLWQRVRYIPVGAKDTDTVTPFPLYYQRDSESLWEVAQRLLNVLRLSHPKLVTEAPVTWPQLAQVGSNAGMVLASLGYQLTEVEDLLFNTLEWERSGRFAEAIRRNPEVAPAVAYFRDHYLPLSRSEKRRVISSFLDHVVQFSHDPTLRLLFSALLPGLDWEEVLEKRRLTVILDCSPLTDPETRRFAILWIMLSLLEHLKGRGRRGYPVALLIDEFAALTHKASEGANQLSELLDAFIAQYMRANQVFLTVCFQSLNQLPDDLQHTILRLGNLVVGRAGTMTEARVLADVLFRNDVFRVKYNHRVWAHEPVINSFTRSIIGTNHFVIDHRPEFMPLEQQQELAAQRIVALPRFSFLLRPATEEGSVSQFVSKIDISEVTKDPETGESVFPDETQIRWLKSRLAKRSGIPVATILKEQEARLKTPLSGAPVPLRREEPAHLPAGKAVAAEPSQRPPLIATPPPPGNAPGSQAPTPQLDEEQQVFLRFLLDHPDTPISAVYKALEVSVWKGEKLRDSLKEQGLIAELAVSRTGAGRPTKFFIPTFQAFELLGREPLHGRGGAIHRHIQQLVVTGATAKGYRTQVEYALENGGIVDVHLEREGVRIACELAVYSTPKREMEHIKNALNAGYNKVIDVFADQRTLERTQEAMNGVFSVEELGKVSLLPLSKLSGVG